MKMVLNPSVNIIYRWIFFLIFPIVFNESMYGHGTGEISNCLCRVLHEVLGCAVAIILTFLCRGMLLTGTYVMFSVSDGLLCVWWCTIFQLIFGICPRCPGFSLSQNVLIAVAPICYVLECPAPCSDTTALSQDVQWDPCRIFIVCIFTATFVHLQIVLSAWGNLRTSEISLPCNWDWCDTARVTIQLSPYL